MVGQNGESARRIWICTYLPPRVGTGVERFVGLFSQALQSAGWDVQIIDAARAKSAGEFAMKIRPLVAWRIGRTANRLAGDDDIILCNGYFSWNARRRKSIVVFHGTELGRAIATKAVTGSFRNAVVRLINARLDTKAGRGRTVVAVSEATKKEIEQSYHLKVNTVIPNAVDLSIFRPADRKAARSELDLPKDKFLVLYAGPADPRKGFDFLLHDLAPRLGPSQQLLITADLENPSSNVTPLGRIDPQRIVSYYQACDAMVMPSLYEGCSFALIEALACGLPCVVSSAGGAQDLLKDEALRPYVIDKLDSGQYAERLKRLENSAEERSRVSAASRRHAEANHSMAGFDRRYRELIEGISRSDAGRKMRDD